MKKLCYNAYWPVSSCLLSKFCNHTWTPKCGQETLQESVRMFLDLCDMHEYNCGKKKDYKEVDIKECHKDDATTTEKHTSEHITEKTVTDTEKTLATIVATIKKPETASLTMSTAITASTIITSPTTISKTSISSKTTENPPTQAKATPSTVITPSATDTVSSSSRTSSALTTTISVTPLLNCTKPTENILTSISSTDTTDTTQSTEKTVTSESIEDTVTTASITENTEITNKDTNDEIYTTKDNSKNREVAEIETIVEEEETETEKVETSPLTPSDPPMVTCSSYPEDCDRPHTWDTTRHGEKRDFFQILQEKFGNKVKILRATTHWPRRALVKNQGSAFYNGRHRDSNFK